VKHASHEAPHYAVISGLPTLLPPYIQIFSWQYPIFKHPQPMFFP